MKLYTCIVSLLIAITAFAQDSTWKSGTGNFTDTTNWDTGLVPGIDDNAFFTNGSYAVSFTRDETNRLATFTSTDSGDVGFDLNNNTWTLTNGFVNSSGALNSKLTVGDGTLIAGGMGINISCLNDALPSYLTLEDVDSELSALVLNNAHMTINGGYHSTSERVYISKLNETGSKNSSLTITNATFVANNSFWCGNENNSTGIVNVLSGGFLIASNHFSVGDQRTTAVGIINIDGGDVYTDQANWVGNAYGATAYINLYDGTFTSRGGFELGHRIRAKAHLNISGGKFTSNSSLLLANYQGDNGVGGTTGTVTITGGELEVKGDTNMGMFTNCFGMIQITENSTSSFARVRVGYGPEGYGNLYLTNGLVTLSNDLEIGSGLNSKGLVTIDGGVFSNKNESALVGVKGTGQMIVNGGDVFIQKRLSSGTAEEGFGEIAVNGGEISSSHFVIGYASGATGTYSQAGGSVATRGGDSLIGDLAGSYGEFLVNGGTLDIDGGFYSGNNGTGIMNISDGIVTFNSGVNAGNHSGSDGSINISGGIVNFNSGMTSGNENGSSGAINITGGAVTNSGIASIGNASGATGSLTIDNEGLYSSDRVYAGNSGTGTLTINDGDNAFMNGLYIGNNSSSTGFVTIAGGTLTNRADSYIGYNGVGHMAISGGTNYFTGTVTVGSNKEGYLNITGGETYITGPRMQTTRGVGSTGRIDMSGGHLTLNGYLDIGASGSCVLEMTGGQIDTGILRMGTGVGSIPVVSKIVMNGGRLNVLNASYLVDKSSLTGEVHLVNGVLSIKQLRGWWGQLEVTFDGGTLEARQHTSTFIYHNQDYNSQPRPLYHILTAHGLVVDSNGYNVGTPLSLPDAPAENGKLTKKGLGRFTIYGTSTFTGPIAVEEGEVDIGSSGMVTLAGGVQIDGGAWLDLHARDQDFTMGADSISRVDGTVELASGRTLIFPSTSSLTGTGTLVNVTMQSGSTLVKNKTTGESNLSIANLTIDSDANIELTGYTAAEFKEGITFISGTNLDLASESSLNFTLNSVEYEWVAVTTTSDGSGGYTVSAKSYDPGTVLVVR